MINCSIVMRPNPLKKEEPKKAYACVQTSKKMNINQFANTSPAMAVSIAVRISRRYSRWLWTACANLLDGVLIKLGDLGDFAPALKSIGAETAADFKTDTHIVGVSVNWTPGERFANLLNEATFNVVPSRKTARKLLKAIKAGETTVDLTDKENTDSESPDEI